MSRRLKSPAFWSFVQQLLRLASKKSSKPALMTLCEGNPMVTGGFSSQMVSGAERVTMSWQHHFPPELVTDKCPTPQPAHRNSKFIAIHYWRNFPVNSRLLDHRHLGLGEKTAVVFIAQMITQRASFWEEYSKFKILFQWILSNWRQIIQLWFGDLQSVGGKHSVMSVDFVQSRSVVSV